MKKELLAGILLISIFIASLINIHYLKEIKFEITDLVKTAAEYAENEDWKKAEEYTKRADKLWSKNDPYTHIVLHHTEINNMSNALNEMLKEIYRQNQGGVKGTAESVLSHLKNMINMETIKFGSIF